MSFLCPTCGKLFSSNYWYERHIYHCQDETKIKQEDILEEDKFICSLCEKEFTRKQYLQLHINKVHSAEMSEDSECTAKCVVCCKLILVHNLERHMIKKHSPKIVEEKINSTNCTVCSKIILLHNLKRHMLQKHNDKVDKSMKKSMPKCIVCKKVVLSNLKRHMIRNHSPVVDDESKFKCSLCANRKYTLQTSLNRHMQQVHNISSTLKMKCPLCTIPFLKVPNNNKKSIYNHFESIHKISMKYEKYNFLSMEEFYTWKCKIEKETISRFLLHTRNSNKLNFRCHRSGKYRSKGCIKRNLKIIGSCKINGFCPASIKVNIVKNNRVEVIFQQTHVGHENDIRFVSLTAEEKKSIADQLANNISMDEILKGIHLSLTYLPLQRIHLTNRKDIQNIRRSLNLTEEVVELSFEEEILETVSIAEDEPEEYCNLSV